MKSPIARLSSTSPVASAVILGVIATASPGGASAAELERMTTESPTEPVRTEAEASATGPSKDDQNNPFGPAARQEQIDYVDLDLKLELAKHEYLYVSQGSGGIISVVDPVTKATWTIVAPEAGNVECLAASTDHGRLYAGSEDKGSVYAFDLYSGKMLEVSPLPDVEPGEPAHPASMTLPEGGGRLYIGDMSGVTIEVRDAAQVDTPIETFLAQYAVNGHMMAFRPGTLDLYLGGFSSSMVGVRTPHFDWQTGQFWNTWAYQQFGMNGGGQQGTVGFDWLEKQGLFVVGNVSKDVLMIIDSATGLLVTYIDTAAMPFRLATSPASTSDAGLIYVPTAQGWTLDVFEVLGQGAGAQVSLVARIDKVCMDEGDEAEAPSEVIFSALRDEAYVLCSHKIRIVDTQTHEIVDTIPLNAVAHAKDMVMATY